MTKKINEKETNFEKMEIFERLKYLRKNILNLCQAEFTKRINITQTNLSCIELHKSTITNRVIKDICREFSVRELWLRFGTGDIFEEKKDEIDNAFNLIFEKLNDKNKTIVLAYLQFLLLLQSGELSSETEERLTKLVKSGKLFTPKNLVYFLFIIKNKRCPRDTWELEQAFQKIFTTPDDFHKNWYIE